MTSQQRLSNLTALWNLEPVGGLPFTYIETETCERCGSIMLQDTQTGKTASERKCIPYHCKTCNAPTHPSWTASNFLAALAKYQ